MSIKSITTNKSKKYIYFLFTQQLPYVTMSMKIYHYIKEKGS